MTKILLSGCNGHMGQSIVALCAAMEDVEIIAGINRTAESKNGFPVYPSPADFHGEADVLIDFSNPANLGGILAFCLDKKLPAVLCTTGYTAEQLSEIDAAAALVPMFRSGNMSLGINLMLELVSRAAAVLGDDFDLEIIEKHHRRKLDAPSGTALMLADAASAALPYSAEYVYDRHSKRERRRREEIGISAIRGGSIVGEHELIFAGQDEVLSIKHTAQSRDVFAAGSISAAKYMASITAPGLYNMRDVIKERLG